MKLAGNAAVHKKRCLPYCQLQKKALIAAAAAAGVEPMSSGGGTLRLKISPAGEPARYVPLLRAGKHTPAGDYYYEVSGRPKPAGPFDPTQQLIQRKNRDFIMVSGSVKNEAGKDLPPARRAVHLHQTGANLLPGPPRALQRADSHRAIGEGRSRRPPHFIPGIHAS